MSRLNRWYIALTYLVFVVMIALIGVVMLVVRLAPLAEALKVLAAWSPTLVLLMMRRRLLPEERFLPFVRRQFTAPIPGWVLSTALLLPLVVLLAGASFVAVVHGHSLPEGLALTPGSLLGALPLLLISGPLGEELGWRAYLHNSLRRRHGVFRTGVIVGLVWGFWHWPLWLVAGYDGPTLAIYVASFLVAIVSLAVIIAVLYDHSGNLLVAIVLHLLFNWTLSLVNLDVTESLPIFAGGYLLAAVGLVFARAARCRLDGLPRPA